MLRHLVSCLRENIIYNRLYCKIGANRSSHNCFCITVFKSSLFCDWHHFNLIALFNKNSCTTMLFELVDILSTLLNVWDQINTMICATMVWGENKKKIYIYIYTSPLNGNCLQPFLIYQATVTRKDSSTTETYIGLTEKDFKTRYRNHIIPTHKTQKLYRTQQAYLDP